MGESTVEIAARRCVVRCCAEGDPARVHRLARRLHGMVIPGEEIHVEFAAAPAASGRIQFVVLDARGELAIENGIAELAG